MIEKIIINPIELDYLFRNQEKNIEISLGSIKNDFWGDNISMVSAIVGKNGTGKSSILKYIKRIKDINLSVSSLSNIIYYSPHLDYNDNYNYDVDVNDISLDSILRRDLEEIINKEKETNSNGWNLNPKEDLQFLNTKRQMDFLTSKLRIEHPIFSEIFEGLKFGYGIVNLRGFPIKYKSIEDFHNTPYQFREIILSIIEKCEIEKSEWTKIRKIKDNKQANQHEINAYLFKRNLIISFLSIVIDVMERHNSYLEEGICDIDYNSENAINTFYRFIRRAKVHFQGQSKEKAKRVFNASKTEELFNLIFTLIRDIKDEELISTKSFVTTYENIEKINSLQKDVISRLEFYYREKEKVNAFLGVKATDRNLSSGENALLNFYSVLYEFVQNIDLDNIHKEYILLLDEADLGYHPEWKKRFVNSIVKSLPLFFNFSNIQSKIQIIFTTHDPLTLSDIPRQNVLFLNKNSNGETVINDKGEDKETFGANIHDLLADSFFISDGLMGDFAKEKINKTITWLKYKLLQKDIEPLIILNQELYEKKRIELEELLRENRWVLESSKEVHKLVIDLVDEPLLKFKLDEMYYQIFPDEVDKDEARRKIKDMMLKSGLNIEDINE